MVDEMRLELGMEGHHFVTVELTQLKACLCVAIIADVWQNPAGLYL